MAGIEYDYDPFSLPIQGMKVPEWVQTNELPFDAFAIADKVKQQQAQQQAADMQAMANTMKILDALKAQQQENAMAQIARDNANLPFDQLAGKMVEGSLASGDVGNALKWAQMTYNREKDEAGRAQKEKDRQLREDYNWAKFDNASKLMDARIQNMQTLAALQAANSQLSREKWDTQKNSAKNWEIYQGQDGQDISLDANDPETVRKLKTGEITLKPKKSGGGLMDLLNLATQQPMPVKMPNKEEIATPKMNSAMIPQETSVKPNLIKIVNKKTGETKYVTPEEASKYVRK